jgi:hypothetical protein
MSTNVDLSTLSIKVIRSLLDANCVSYMGIIEKSELVARLQSLIDNTLAGRALVKEQEELAAAAAEAEAKAKANPDAKGDKPPSSNSNEDDHLCKICCDAALNCVMLNCNHMSTCMDW